MSNQLERENNNESNFTEDWHSMTDEIQSIHDLVFMEIFRKHREFSDIFSGNFGEPAFFFLSDGKI